TSRDDDESGKDPRPCARCSMRAANRTQHAHESVALSSRRLRARIWYYVARSGKSYTGLLRLSRPALRLRLVHVDLMGGDRRLKELEFACRRAFAMGYQCIKFLAPRSIQERSLLMSVRFEQCT